MLYNLGVWGRETGVVSGPSPLIATGWSSPSKSKGRPSFLWKAYSQLGVFVETPPSADKGKKSTLLALRLATSLDECQCSVHPLLRPSARSRLGSRKYTEGWRVVWVLHLRFRVEGTCGRF